MFLSIKKKIILSQMALFFTALGVLFVANYFSLKSEIEKVYFENISVLLFSQEQGIEDRLNKKFLILGRICESKEFQDYAVTNRDLALSKYFSKFKDEFSSISYLDQEGKAQVSVVEGSSTLDTQAFDLNDQRFLFSLLERKNEPAVKLRYSEGASVPMLDFYIARYQYFGDKFSGLIRASVPLEQFFAWISGEKPGKAGAYFLVDKESNILLSSISMNNFLGKFHVSGKEEGVLGLADAGSGVPYVLIGGRRFLFEYTQIKSLECFLVAVLPYAEITRPVYIIRNSYLAVSLVLFLLVIFFVCLLTQYIVAPIRELVLSVGKVAQGDFSVRMKISGHDEISLLVASFNKMAEALDQSVVSKVYMDSIIMNMQDMLMVVSFEKKILFVNEALCRLLGYKNEELIGLNMDILFLHKGMDLEKEVMNKKNYETIILSRFLSKVPVLLSCVFVEALSVKGRCFILTAKDITERKGLESALSEKEQLARDLIDIYPDAIVVTDEDLYIDIVNQAAILLFGCKDEREMIGRNFTDFVVMDDLPVVLAAKNRTDVSKGKEITVKKDSGSLAFVAFNMGVIGGRENNKKIIFLIRDISSQKKSDLGL